MVLEDIRCDDAGWIQIFFRNIMSIGELLLDTELTPYVPYQEKHLPVL
jgi:hypothetical protein